MKRGALPALLLALLAPCPAAAGLQALRPLPTNQGSYGESFTFIGDLDDGTYLQLTLALTNFGPGGIKAICRALVVAPGAKPWNASTRVGNDGWKWSDADEERLAIGPCAASVDERETSVEVPLEGGRVKLVFAARPLKRSLVHDAVVVVEGNLYRTEVRLFRAGVTATLALPGQPARTVAGAGFADHTRSAIRPKDLFESWVRFRGLRGERGLLLLGRQGRDRAFKPLWACEDRDRCREFQGYEIRRLGAGKAPAFEVALTGPDRGLPLLVKSGALLYRDAPVEDLGILGKLVAPIVGSPVTYVYRGTAHDGVGPPIDGILEVEVAGE